MSAPTPTSAVAAPDADADQAGRLSTPDGDSDDGAATGYRSPLLDLPGAVAAHSPDAGVAAHYGDPLREQRGMADGAVLVDRSHRGVVRIDGPDRLGWLHNLTSQHLSGLAPMRGTEALVLSPHGHVEHHLLLADDGTTSWIDVEPGTAETLLGFLSSMRFMLRVEPADASGTTAVLSVLGPRAIELVGAALLGSAPETEPAPQAEPTPAAAPGSAAGGTRPAGSVRPAAPATPAASAAPAAPVTSATPGPAWLNEAHVPAEAGRYPVGRPTPSVLVRAMPYGLDLLVERSSLVETVDRLRAAGVTPAGIDAFEAARIVVHRPRLGVDTDHRTIPHEVGWLTDAVHLDKGCYRGQETVARVHNLGRPPRRLVLLHLDGAVAATGSPLTAAGRTVGFVGSSGTHTELGPVALGMVKRSVPDETDLVATDAEGHQIAARIDPDSAPTQPDRPAGRMLRRP